MLAEVDLLLFNPGVSGLSEMLQTTLPFVYETGPRAIYIDGWYVCACRRLLIDRFDCLEPSDKVVGMNFHILKSVQCAPRQPWPVADTYRMCG